MNDRERTELLRILKRSQLGKCPLPGPNDDYHDTTLPIYGGQFRDLGGQLTNGPVIGYSCNKCHKTWDREWRPTYGSPSQ